MAIRDCCVGEVVWSYVSTVALIELGANVAYIHACIHTCTVLFISSMIIPRASYRVGIQDVLAGTNIMVLLAIILVAYKPVDFAVSLTRYNRNGLSLNSLPSASMTSVLQVVHLQQPPSADHQERASERVSVRATVHPRTLPHYS